MERLAVVRQEGSVCVEKTDVVHQNKVVQHLGSCGQRERSSYNT